VHWSFIAEQETSLGEPSMC